MSKKVKRLFTQFQPQNYRIELHPDRETMRFSGSVVITGRKIDRPSQRITFHQKDLKVSAATIVKKDKKGEHEVTVERINCQHSFDEVRLHTKDRLYPGEYEITLHFSGDISDGMHGIYPCYYEIDGQKQKLIATQFESHHAREAFPCIDEPEAKATFDLTLVAPENEAVLSNTPLAHRDGDKIIFETTPKMSTYLLAFVYGDLHCREAATKEGVDVRIWATRAHSSESLDFALDVAVRTIEFFNDYFGVPYPLTKCDHVALPDFSSGAMENWGLITYREAALLADPTTASQSSRELVAMVVAHETSHQWFGNLVTMRWWDNLWLNESFANLMEYAAVDALFPDWHVWDSFTAQEGLAAIRRDAIAGVQPVQCEVRHPDEISTLFDPSIVYAKGGRLLSMLMGYIGEPAFREGLKAYFTQHAYANTTGDDLWAALSASSKKDVAAFMNPWILQSGFPVVHVSQVGRNITIKQSHFLLDSSKVEPGRLWPVPLLASNAELPVLLEDGELTAVVSSDNYVRINQGAVGHFVVQYSDAQHTRAISSLVAAQKLTVAERLMLLNDSSMLARAGMQSFAASLELLEQYQQEDNESVWDIMALIVADCRRFIDIDPELETPINKLVRNLIDVQYQRLGWHEEPSEPSQDTKLRALIMALGVFARHENITQEALRLFAAYKQDEHIVPTELRGIVFCAAIYNHQPDAFDYLLELDQSTQNADLKQDIISALTATKRTDETTILLSRLKDPDLVRQQDVVRWLAYLARNRHVRPLAWQWVRDNWGWIEEVFSGDKTYDAFPRYTASAFNTQALAHEYRTFFEPMQDIPALGRNITLGFEELESRVAWLARDISAVQNYFQENQRS